MKRTRSLESIAGASAALVQDYDLAGALIKTVTEATELVGAEAGGLLVTNTRGELELLSATSHRTAELEAYQTFSGEGPCVECVEEVATVALDLDGVAARWPALATMMEDAGYVHVLASPLRWRGAALGGLNLFWQRAPDDMARSETEAQVFSDILTLFIVTSGAAGPEMARERIERALAGRAVIEQAKGVLAEREGLDMSAAYERLLELERSSGDPLTEVAERLITHAQVG